MPNPTSKLNLVINGVTTQLDIHDANAVDLTNNQTVAGNKEFTGTTTAHDLVPSATATYNLGSSSYQWNNAYIKSLTINGVACGDILTHNVSEFVDVTSAQTIGGVKTFSFGGCTFFKQIKINHNLQYGKNNPPSQSAYHNLMFTSANDWWGGYIENVTDTNGNSTLAFYVRNTNEIQSRVYLKCDINGSFSMYPLSHNAWDLGISTNKWKSFNGINPGALSLPSGTVGMNLIGDVSVAGIEKKLSKDITVTGFVYVDVSFSSTSSNRLNLYNDTKKYGIWIPCNSGRIRQIMPISAGDRLEFNVLDDGTTINAIQIFTCQGNV